MKHIYLLVLIIFLSSCQNEEFFESVEENTSLSSKSELSKIISRLNQNPTAFDDFIDNTSSLSLEFPFEITVNSSSNFSLNELSDYQPLINELSNLTEGYTIDINFPVEVSLPNYEKFTLQNQTEFDAVVNSVEGSFEINCLTYEFPLEINIFNPANSLTTRQILQNKAQFFNLIQNLQQTNGFYEIVYPISLTSEGNSLSVSSNIELNSVIENLDDSCFNPLLFVNPQTRLQQFVAFITSGEFEVFQYIDDDDGNETNNYENLKFTFNVDFSIRIENMLTGEFFVAEWDAEIDDGDLVFELDLDDIDDIDIFDKLDEDWRVIAFANPDKIILQDNDDGDVKILIFRKI